MTAVNQRLRARDAWEILIGCANKKTSITYGDLAARLGTHPRACRFFLGLIQKHCKSDKKGLPPLQILAVGKKGIPGHGFTEGGKGFDATRQEVYSFRWDTEPNPFEYAASPSSLVDERKDKFKEWMKMAKKGDGGRYSVHSINQYRSYIQSMPDFLKQITGTERPSLFLIDSVAEARAFFNEFRGEFETVLKKQHSKAVSNFNSAFELYINFLEEESQSSSSLEITLNSPSVTASEKVQLINIRIGQGKFRDDLIKIWGGCSVSGYEDNSLLIASHIKPWSACKESRLNPFNGLLLTPNLDRAFDKGLITFEKDGTIRISKKMRNPEALGISNKMKVKLRPENEPFMMYHRETKFQK